MDEIAHAVFRFDGFSLEPMRRLLRNGDQPINLRPKSFDVLCYLVVNAGRVVGKDEVMTAVWSDVVVSDESLARCVSDIRSALGDSGQRIIKTVPRRGYLFAAPLSNAPAVAKMAAPVEAAIEPSDTPKALPETLSSAVAKSSRRPWRTWIAGAASAVAVAACIAIVTLLPRQPAPPAPPDRPAIAVLPFANMGAAQHDYFVDGISQDITTSLSKFADLLVIARDSAARYRDPSTDSRQVGQDLGVRYLLRGTVRSDAERFRVTAALVDAENGEEVWADRYDREAGGIFAVQDEITQKIVLSLVKQINRTELARGLNKPPQRLAAYDHYLRGNAALANRQTAAPLEAVAVARTHYEQALQIDPHYAPALQALAGLLFLSWGNPKSEDFQKTAVLDRAVALAQRAVEQDESLAEAHATLGWLLRWHRPDHESIPVFRRAFAVNPNFVDGRFGIMLAHGGEPREAIEYMQRIMRLDPLYPPNYTHYLGKSYFFLGQYDRAIELIRSASAAMPGIRQPRVTLAAVAAHLGRNDEARSAAAEVLELDSSFSTLGYVKTMKLVRREDAARLIAGLRLAGLPE